MSLIHTFASSPKYDSLLDYGLKITHDRRITLKDALYVWYQIERAVRNGTPPPSPQKKKIRESNEIEGSIRFDHQAILKSPKNVNRTKSNFWLSNELFVVNMYVSDPRQARP